MRADQLEHREQIRHALHQAIGSAITITSTTEPVLSKRTLCAAPYAALASSA